MKSNSKKPSGYWTKERVKLAALNYKTRTKFQYSKKHAGAYRKAQRQGWLDEVCAHMELVKHGYNHCVYVIKNDRLNMAYIGVTRGKFENRVKQHKLKSNDTRSKKIAVLQDTEFVQLTDYLYPPNEVKGIETKFYKEYLDKGFEVLNSEATLGSVGLRDPYWTLDKVKEEALKYKTRTDFQVNSKAAYSAAQYNGWLDRIYDHMEEKQKPNGYWTLDRVEEEALKYDTRSDSKNHSSAAYDFSLRQGWIDQVCAHMKVIQEPKGSWTFERVMKEANKFTNTGDFQNKSKKAYSAARNHGWYDLVTAHMEKRNPKGYWTKNRVKQEALKYKTRSDFQKTSGSAYVKARAEKWLDEVCSHMLSPSELRDKEWDFDATVKEASKYKSNKDFMKGSPYAYRKAKKEGWLTKIRENFLVTKRAYKVKYTKDFVRQEAQKFTNRYDFNLMSPSAYRKAQKSGWLDDICSHMTDDVSVNSKHKPNGYWTKERILEEAKRYKTKSEFQANNGSALTIARNKGWLGEACSHMQVENKKPSGYWTFVVLLKEASKYKSKNEFVKGSPLAARAAKRKGWLDELFDPDE